MSKVFLSYNRRSRNSAKNLVEDIETLAHMVWFDQELTGGQAWWDRILTMIRESDVLVFLLDQESLNSTACQREFGYAADLGKPILPVLCADGISTNLLPPELSRIQFVDYRQRDRHSAFTLARAFAGLPPPKPLPDPLPAPPEVPVSYLGSLGRKLETAPVLSFDEQSALLVDLKRSLREANSADDTRTLLAKLRKRRDLYATIAEEIDELLRSPAAPVLPPLTTAAQPALQESPEPDAGQIPATGRISVKRAEPATPPAPAMEMRLSTATSTYPSQRWLGAFGGTALGVLMGIWAVGISPSTSSGDYTAVAGILGAVGAISGALTGIRPKMILTVCAGYAAGFLVALMFHTSPDAWRYPIAMLYGGGSGAIVGAAGAVIFRRPLGSPGEKRIGW
jgi:hypothetical protein